MAQAPSFLDGDDGAQLDTQEVFRASPANRRSETLAWTLALGLALSALVGRWRGAQAALFIAELAAFFVVISLWISLGNWIDRRSSIDISGTGVRYRSPLRTISLDWKVIDDLWAIPSGSSWRIVVRGQGARFSFRTSSELRVGRRSVKVGYPEGERLARSIRLRSGLSRAARANGDWVCSRQTGVSE
jgi:hypothetical protein